LLAGASVVTGSPCAYDVALWVFAETLAHDVELLPKDAYEARTCCLPFCPLGSPRLNYTGSIRGKARLLIQSTRMGDYELVLRMVMYRRELEHMFDETARARRGSAADFAAIGALARRPAADDGPLAAAEQTREVVPAPALAATVTSEPIAVVPSGEGQSSSETKEPSEASSSSNSRGAAQRSARSINLEEERRRREEKRR
jgi:hypothetical protein